MHLLQFTRDSNKTSLVPRRQQVLNSLLDLLCCCIHYVEGIIENVSLIHHMEGELDNCQSIECGLGHHFMKALLEHFR